MNAAAARALVNRSSALQVRANAHADLARADELAGADPSENYERACEYFRLYAEAQIDISRRIREGK